MAEKTHHPENSRPRRPYRAPRHYNNKRFYRPGARDRQPEDDREREPAETGAPAAPAPHPAANSNGMSHETPAANGAAANPDPGGAGGANPGNGHAGTNGNSGEDGAAEDNVPRPQVLNLSGVRQA